MARIVVQAFLLLCLCASTAFGQTRASGLEVLNYKALEYLIEGLPDNAKKLGLTEDRLRTKLELRLRQAGIRPTDGSQATTLQPYLYVRASVVGRGFNVSLEFKRLTSYEVGSQTYRKFSSTWDTGITGIANDGDYILSGFDDVMDVFLNAYLKTNQK